MKDSALRGLARKAGAACFSLTLGVRGEVNDGVRRIRNILGWSLKRVGKDA
jgi:hypothetical protein